jgi:hypothetical protein
LMGSCAIYVWASSCLQADYCAPHGFAGLGLSVFQERDAPLPRKNDGGSACWSSSLVPQTQAFSPMCTLSQPARTVHLLPCSRRAASPGPHNLPKCEPCDTVSSPKWTDKRAQGKGKKTQLSARLARPFLCPGRTPAASRAARGRTYAAAGCAPCAAVHRASSTALTASTGSRVRLAGLSYGLCTTFVRVSLRCRTALLCPSVP